MNCRVSKNLCGLLERSCRQERACGKRRLGNSENDLLAFRRLLVESCKSLVLILKVKDIYQASGKEFGVAAVLDPDLAEHLSDDNFDVLIADMTLPSVSSSPASMVWPSTTLILDP